jgi:hypothetical protein
MSLKIVFNTNLEKREANDFINLDNQLSLNLDNPSNYYSEYEKTNNLINKSYHYTTKNNFVNAFLHSYNLHKPIKIRPDDIKLQLLMIISNYVNNNAELLRNLFVEHEGKKELEVYSLLFSADYFCEMFSQMMEKNIKNPEFAQHFKSKFTTTTRLISTVNNITLMNTLKEYYSCTMVLGCGIPSIILEGTQEDWNKLKDTYEYFKSFSYDSELKDWYNHFDLIFNMFIEMRQLKDNGVVNEDDTPHHIKELFKRVISYVPEGSGGDKILGGWIRLFCPYSNKNKIIGGLDKPIACLDITKQEPIDNDDIDYYKWQDIMRDFYLASDWGSISTSFITTPAKLIDDDKKYMVEFYSGFFAPHLNLNDEIEMNIGLCMRENMDIKKENMKKMYIEKGVICEPHHYIGYVIKIPKVLRKEYSDIMKCFDVSSCSFYGVDPEQEKQKEYYSTNGVYKEKGRWYIPKKFEHELDLINDAFDNKIDMEFYSRHKEHINFI